MCACRKIIERSIDSTGLGCCSQTNVYGPVPPAPGVTVILPFVAPLHELLVAV